MDSQHLPDDCCFSWGTGINLVDSAANQTKPETKHNFFDTCHQRLSFGQAVRGLSLRRVSAFSYWHSYHRWLKMPARSLSEPAFWGTFPQTKCCCSTREGLRVKASLMMTGQWQLPRHYPRSPPPRMPFPSTASELPRGRFFGGNISKVSSASSIRKWLSKKDPEASEGGTKTKNTED